MSTIAVKWSGPGSQMFVGRDTNGHVVVAGTWSDDDNPGWQAWHATRPSDLLLISLASCSAYDVVMIMGRQRQTLTNLYVQVDGVKQPDPPHAFVEIHLHYILTGRNLNSEKVARAITLSEKYCSVSATIRGVATITHSFELVDG